MNSAAHIPETDIRVSLFSTARKSPLVVVESVLEKEGDVDRLIKILEAYRALLMPNSVFYSLSNEPSRADSDAPQTIASSAAGPSST